MSPIATLSPTREQGHPGTAHPGTTENTLHIMLPCATSPQCLHRICDGCKNLLRKPGKGQQHQHPGTITGHGLDKPHAHCSNCRTQITKHAKQAPDLQDCKQCKRCQKYMRSNGTNPTDVPGTVEHKQHGFCTDCHNKPWTQQELQHAASAKTGERFSDAQLRRLAGADRGLCNYVLARRGLADSDNRLKRGR